MNQEKFIKELERINIYLTEDQQNQLDKYYELLIETNKVLNLTAITEKEDVYLKHFYDSLTLIKAYDLKEELKICDLGTGAGFPGLVLKIVFPNLKVTLVDSLEKRTKFLKQVIETLNLKDIEVIHSRIEDFSKQNKEKYDISVSRAVAKTNILLELSSQVLKINGSALFMKSNILEELKEAENAIETLNYKVDDIIEFTLPIEESKRTILKLKKIKPTNNKYPRDFAQIKKKPL